MLDDIVYSVWPERATGGQSVGSGPSGIMGVHPSGIVACVDSHRSQHKNKQAVKEMIEWTLSSMS